MFFWFVFHSLVCSVLMHRFLSCFILITFWIWQSIGWTMLYMARDAEVKDGRQIHWRWQTSLFYWFSRALAPTRTFPLLGVYSSLLFRWLGDQVHSHTNSARHKLSDLWSADLCVHSIVQFPCFRDGVKCGEEGVGGLNYKRYKCCCLETACGPGVSHSISLLFFQGHPRLRFSWIPQL